MSVSVRVRNLPELLDRVEAAGSQRQLAGRVGISATSINSLVQGKRSTVRLDTAAGIEDALGVPRGSLFVITDLDLVCPYTRDAADAA